MTVLRMDASVATHEYYGEQAEPPPRGGTLATVSHILWSELPSDVRDCEVTVVVLFRASQLLNFLTGGDPAMTFSARAWRARRTAKWLPMRLGWILMTAGVDAACGILRGELDHCAAAWSNYVKRDRQPKYRQASTANL